MGFTQWAVVRMASEPIVTSVWQFILWSNGSQLCGVKLLEIGPYVLHWPQEKYVCVHV